MLCIRIALIIFHLVNLSSFEVIPFGTVDRIDLNIIGKFSFIDCNRLHCAFLIIRIRIDLGAVV